MPRELRPLSRAHGLRPAVVGGRPGWGADGLVLGTVGIGTRAAAGASARILDELRPSRVVIVGVAGALDPDLQIAEVIVPSSVVDAETGRAYTPDASGVSPGRACTLVTVQRFGDPVPDGACAVDMESAAVAAECERRSIRWEARRAISDLPGVLRTTIAALVDTEGRPELAGVVRLLAREPRQLAVLLRLGRDTSRAIRALNESVSKELRRAEDH